MPTAAIAETTVIKLRFNHNIVKKLLGIAAE